MHDPSPHTPSSNRLRSLDALRGFDMFWIVCGEGIFHGIASAIRQKHALTQSTVDWKIEITSDLGIVEKIFIGISNQLHHSVWNGFTFYDLIFPLFIFIAGVSMPYSFGKQLGKEGLEKAAAKKKIYRGLIRRTVILVLLGMMVNGALQLNGYNNTRFASVLGRIALSCFFAALIYLNCSVKKQLLWLLVLLTGYWAAMMWIPVPGHGAGVLTPEGNLSGHIDRLLLPGKLHRGSYDPEGLLSTIPAIATALLGIFVGQFMLDHWRMKPANAKSLPQSPGEVRSPVTNRYPSKKAGLVFVSGIILLISGWGWGMLFPVNKNIWTSSFVLYSAGWSMMLFAVFYYIIDVKGYKTWSNPFIWMGMNAILIYIAAHGLVNFGSASEFLFGGLINKTPETWHPALLWSGVALVQFALLYFLYKKKWFLKM